MIYLLHKINPDRNQARYYRIRVGPSVVGLYALHRAWGRLGRRRSGFLIQPCADEAEARRLAERLVQAKLRRGYVVVEVEL